MYGVGRFYLKYVKYSFTVYLLARCRGNLVGIATRQRAQHRRNPGSIPSKNKSSFFLYPNTFSLALGPT